MTKVETVSDLVRKDYRTAAVFKKYGIGNCCHATQSLEEVCKNNQLDLPAIRAELQNATRSNRLNSSICVEEWSIDFMIDYILHIHHAYLRKALPALQAGLASFAAGHPAQYPKAGRLEQIMEELAAVLFEHMAREEDSLFPYLRQIANTFKRKETYGRLFVRMLRQPLDQVKKLESTHISALLTQLRQETGNYQMASDACNEYRVMVQQLQELDEDLAQHKYLENTVLFPKAMEMEKELLQQ